MRTFDNLFSKINKQIRQMSFMILRRNLGAKYMDIIDGFELIMNRVIEIFMIHMEILRYIIFCGIVSRYILSDM